MKRFACVALILAAASPAAARSPLFGPPANYYGPLKNWFGAGYKEELQKDGSWRVLAESRAMDGEGFARNAVIYRAAEIARDQGHDYLQVLGGTITRGTGLANYGQESAKIFVRPADAPERPATCKWKDAGPGNCYTARVSDILARVAPLLGLAGPARPSFGAPPPQMATSAVRYTPAPVRAAPATAARSAPRTTLEARLRAAAPVKGREPTQGWTISD